MLYDISISSFFEESSDILLLMVGAERVIDSKSFPEVIEYQEFGTEIKTSLKVSIDGETVKLTHLQSSLFKLFISKPNDYVSLVDIKLAVWSDINKTDIQTIQLIRRLRANINDARSLDLRGVDTGYIHMTESKGYMFRPIPLAKIKPSFEEPLVDRL